MPSGSWLPSRLGREIVNVMALESRWGFGKSVQRWPSNKKTFRRVTLSPTFIRSTSLYRTLTISGGSNCVTTSLPLTTNNSTTGRITRMPMHEMGVRGREWMTAEFSWDRAAAATAAVYASISGRSNATSASLNEQRAI